MNASALLDQSTWRDLLPEEPLALGISVGLHLAVAAAMMVSVSWTLPPPPPTPTLSTFDVSFAPGDPGPASVPQLAAPTTAPDVAPAELPTEAVDQEAEPARPTPAPRTPAETPDVTDADAAGAPGDAGTIWTPPPPKPNAAETAMLEDGAAAPTRVVMPVVVIGKGASEPVLLSYDQARWTDAVSIREAQSIAAQGRITMSVFVDAAGKVSRCDVTTTSGSRLFDDRACALVRSYEYRPASDAAGRAHDAMVVEVLEWARDGSLSAPADVTTPAGQATPPTTRPSASGRPSSPPRSTSTPARS